MAFQMGPNGRAGAPVSLLSSYGKEPRKRPFFLSSPGSPHLISTASGNALVSMSMIMTMSSDPHDPSKIPGHNAAVSPEESFRQAGRATAVSAIRAAMEQFGSLTGRTPEAVSGVRALPEGGWSVLVDVVELERVPATTSVMATYRVDVDATGELFACERLRRFTRGTTDI